MQGTHGWARVLKYYKTNPITADGGVNVIYETHIYNHAGDFNKLLTDPASVLPVIIGEMGPAELDGEGQLQVRRTTLFPFWLLLLLLVHAYSRCALHGRHDCAIMICTGQLHRSANQACHALPCDTARLPRC
jgi:hypothetical protein